MGSIPGRMGGHQPHLTAPSAKSCPATIENYESVPRLGFEGLAKAPLHEKVKFQSISKSDRLLDLAIEDCDRAVESVVGTRQCEDAAAVFC
jgi:hypothetical protein